MKKIILSALLLTTLVIAESDINHPIERIEAGKDEKKDLYEKSFIDRFHFKGDLRLRYESKEATYFDDTEKNVYQNRYRLRLGAHVDITDNLQFEVGMRSGNANPTSGNQTFANDDALSNYFWKSLRFNAVALDYKYGDSALKVGRAAYMMYRPLKSQLVWDNDISLDGINYQYNDKSNLITFGINQIDFAEASVNKNIINLVIAQYVRTIKLSDSKLNLGAGFYYYDGVKGNTSLYTSNKGSSMGNTMVDATGTQVTKNGVFVNDYHILEGFAEYKMKDVFGQSVGVAAGVVYNAAASDKNFGYDLAVKVGAAKKVGDLQLKYSYTDLQEDATLGAHSDSDNFGGGTAAKGHAIRTKYKFGKNTYLAGTWFYNTRYASKDGKTGDTDYERVQLDAIIKF
ncbi:Outer membrane receptor for ferric coprogen and ferric-rhodotorulic acid [hydrothermal vent metagenome]|uniref:Outer membrane receptor for ferric coprogen and ferric-rhodotorulic acid n=1 Tax=hydrothermal vent metagenome TaxID=652676 RepID=A0A1W1BD94_9ZZZZ